MVPLDVLDDVVIEATLDDDRPHMERVWVAGDSRADDVARLREQAMRAYRAGDKARFLELDAQADALDAMPKVRPHWDERMSCGCTRDMLAQHMQAGHHCVTEGRHFASLDLDARREYLATWEITASWDGVTRDDDGEITGTPGKPLPLVTIAHRSLTAT